MTEPKRQPGPVPDELWLPLKRRIELFNAVVIAAMACMVTATIALLSVWWAPSWVAWRVGAPLGIVGLVLGRVGLTRGKRELAKMRLLIIEYCGVDPEVKR
jgi:hypothetical protein